MAGTEEEIRAIIAANIAQVTGRIEAAARAAGRRAEDVRLVVVTKAQPAEVIRAVVAAGARILGENYPQESQPKIEALGRLEGVEWHMIGHLQSRKVPIVTDYFNMLESLDSLRLAEKMNLRLASQERIFDIIHDFPVLLEVNVGGEESKYGWNVADDHGLEAMLQDIEKIMGLPTISVRGLMTMPPLYDDAEQARPFFARLRLLSEALARRFGAEHFRELSMGTSADYEAAVQEGATLVRVGTAILGPRPPKTSTTSGPEAAAGV